MHLLRPGIIVNRTERVPRRTATGAALEQSLHFASLGGAEDAAIGTEQFQSIPRRRIMAGGDLDAAGRLQSPHGQTDGRRRRDAEIVDLAAGRGQSGQYRMTQHDAAGPAIAADDDASAAGVAPRAEANASAAAGVSDCPTIPRMPETLTINPCSALIRLSFLVVSRLKSWYVRKVLCPGSLLLPDNEGSHAIAIQLRLEPLEDRMLPVRDAGHSNDLRPPRRTPEPSAFQLQHRRRRTSPDKH